MTGIKPQQQAAAENIYWPKVVPGQSGLIFQET